MLLPPIYNIKSEILPKTNNQKMKKAAKNYSNLKISVSRKHSASFVHIAKKLQTFSDNKTVIVFSILLFLLTVFAYYPNVMDDFDIWWHMKYGEHYVNNSTWNIDHTMYSWTPTNGEWKYVTWIGSSILYLIYKSGGLVGLTLFKWLIITGVLFQFLLFIKYFKDKFSLTHLTGFLLVITALNPKAIIIKPDSFTILFFTFTVSIYFFSKLSSKNYFYIYPLIFLIWVNTHGAFIIGLFFISLIYFLEICNLLFIKKNNMPKSLVGKFTISIVFSYLVLLINPHGVGYPAELIRNMLSGERVHFAAILEYANNWQHLFPSTYAIKQTNSAWSLVLMGIIIFTLLLYVFRKRKFFDITLILINIVFFVLGMNISRASIFFPIVWFFSFEYVLIKNKLIRIQYTLAPAALLLFLFGASVCMYCTIVYNPNNSSFGLNIDDLIPAKEAEYIIDNDLPVPLYNDYLPGGYVIWAMYPEYKAFIDSRHVPYVKSGLWDDYYMFLVNPTEENYENINSKHHFNSAIIYYLRYPLMNEFFIKSTDWTLLYFNTCAAVFVRNNSWYEANKENLKTDLSPSRFKHVHNPIVLQHLFRLYARLNLKNAEEIMKIYDKNVSGLYKYKRNNLEKMNYNISLIRK